MYANRLPFPDKGILHYACRWLLRLSGRVRTFGLAAVAIAGFSLNPLEAPAASIRQDANGFVVMEAENFDLNLTQDNGEWKFDKAPPTWAQTNSGWGYMKGEGAGGISMTTSPRLDFKVRFNVTGPNYLWVLGSEVTEKDITMGLDGVVTTNSINIGGPDGAFGAPGQGEWFWVGTNNAGSPLKWVNKSYLNVTSAVDHTVNLFLGSGMWVDKIVLTTNVAWEPTPLNQAPPGIPDGNATNIPAPVIVGSPLLSIAMTQPVNNQSFTANSNLVLNLSAKAVTNGTFSVSKIEFFARKQPSGPNSKIGEASTPPYRVLWTNPAVADYDLTAKATDSGSRVATSAVVVVSIKAPPSYTTPLVWTTNTFDTGLGSWTLGSDTHASGFYYVPWYFSLDWTNASLAGGSPGELYVHTLRMATVAPYLAQPLTRRVSLNEELWMRGRVYCRNFGPDLPPGPSPETNRISANADVFIGYFDSAVFGQPPRIGLKIREPNNTYPTPGPWRLYAGQGGFEFDTLYSAPETNAFEFEFHWTPDGTGDGAGTFSGWIFDPGQTIIDRHYGPSPVTYDAFGYVSPAQGSDEPWRQQEHAFDDLRYLIPASQNLYIQLLDSTKVLLSWAIPDHVLQYADGVIPTSHTNAAWTDINTNSVANVGGRFYYTNSIGGNTRWYQLRHPLQ